MKRLNSYNSAFTFRTHDYENFVCTLLLKNTARSTAFAVRSFNIEIARVAEQVTQQNTALMRFKFWEDTLEKCLTKDITSVPKHPVAMELFRVIYFLYVLRIFNNKLLLEFYRQTIPQNLPKDILITSLHPGKNITMLNHSRILKKWRHMQKEVFQMSFI